MLTQQRVRLWNGVLSPKRGHSYGKPLCPSVSYHFFLDRLEQRALSRSVHKPVFLVRYIDDYARIWTHGALAEFLSYLNSLHPSIQFTLDHSREGKGVPFLDTLIFVLLHVGALS